MATLTSNSLLQLKNVLYRMALRITLNTQEAEDVVQDTLLKLWDRREQLGEINSVEAFAMTMCRNIALDHRKLTENTNYSLDALDFDRVDNSLDPIEKMHRQEQMGQIKNIMATLPEKQRTCMQLRDFEGKSYKDIAEIMNMSEENVKINIFRARKTVKEKIFENNL